MENKIIRTCPSCNTPISILDIACNPTLQPAGMDSIDGTPKNLCYTFVHTPCGSSMMIRVEELRSLLPMFAESDDDSSCPCLDRWTYDAEVHHTCDSPCKYEPYRRFMAGITQIKELAATRHARTEFESSTEAVTDEVAGGSQS